MINRTTTDQDRENARRLFMLWKAKKGPLNLDQKKAASLLGYASQSMVSQQLHCKVALNTEAILKWAHLLQVPASEIDPTLGTFGIADATLRRTRVRVVTTMSGAAPGASETVEIVTRMTRQMYSVSVDIDGFEPFAKKGSHLIVSTDEEPISGDEVFIVYKMGEKDIHLIKRFVATDNARGVIVVKGLTSEEVEELDAGRVTTLDPIVSVERPIVNRPIRLRAKAAE